MTLFSEMYADLKKIKGLEMEDGVQFNMETKCPICWDALNGQKSIFTTPCKHVYHTECITDWLKIGSTCPLCVRTLKNPPLAIYLLAIIVFLMILSPLFTLCSEYHVDLKYNPPLGECNVPFEFRCGMSIRGDSVQQCTYGKWWIYECSPGLKCYEAECISADTYQSILHKQNSCRRIDNFFTWKSK
jgi:hypothetical protein